MRTLQGLVAMVAMASAVVGPAGCGRAPSPDRPAAAGDTAVTATVAAVTDTHPELQRPAIDPDDRCRMTDPAGKVEDDSAALRNGVTFRCALRDGGPEVRLVVGGEWGIPMGLEVFSPADAARSSQQLAIDSDERAPSLGGIVTGEDLNDDGWTDLKVLAWSGTGGAFYDVFMYAAGRRGFVKDSVLSGKGGVVPDDDGPCVWTGRRMGTGYQSSAEFCWSGGRWVLERTRTHVWISGSGDGSVSVWVDSVRERVGSEMRLRVDTVRDTIR